MCFLGEHIMDFQIDKTKKNDKELVLEKRVPLFVRGKSNIYFMTNDYSKIVEKLTSINCRIPENEDFIENPALANNVRLKMKSLGANWSLVLSGDLLLNYIELNEDKAFMVPLRKLTKDGCADSILKIFEYILEEDLEKLESLINSGYDVNQYFGYGFTPLMIACLINKSESVKLLLELGADINAVDVNDCTSLMYVAKSNNAKIAKLLLSNPNINLEQKDCRGCTAVQIAAKNKSLNVISLLIEAGADINSIDYEGESILSRSFKNNTIDELFYYLIRKGININYINKYGESILMLAVKHGQLDIVERLIKMGAKETYINDKSPFIIAAENNKTRLVELLLQSQKISEDEYINAIIASSKKGNIDATSILIEKSSNPGKMAFIALIYACIGNNLDMIHLCMDYNCDINKAWRFGFTPLLFACYLNSDKAVAQLIAYEADINQADEDGITALMYAASKNNTAIINLLLRNGADKNVKDKNGKTFKDYLKILDNRNYHELLIDKAKKHIPDENRKDDIPLEQQPFIERLEWYIQKYFEKPPKKGDGPRKLSDIYKKPEMSKQTFSKIRSNRNRDFRPKKDSVIQLAFGLELNEKETEDLLHCAGYAFSQYDRRDLIIKKTFHDKKSFDDCNDELEEKAQETLFRDDLEEE